MNNNQLNTSMMHPQVQSNLDYHAFFEASKRNKHTLASPLTHSTEPHSVFSRHLDVDKYVGDKLPLGI